MIVFHFDVLALPSSSLATRQPHPDGVRLWRLHHDSSGGRIGLLVDDSYEQDKLEHWLKMEGIKAAVYDFAPPVADLKADKVHYLTSINGKMDWYVDVDPETCALTLAKGIPTMLVMTPSTVPWSPQNQMKGWDTLVDEIERQKLEQSKKEWEL